MPDPTERLNAALEGRYSIERELGAEIDTGMNRRGLPLIVGLLLALGCGGTPPDSSSP